MHGANEIPLYSLIPFVLMLGSIAVMPLVTPHFWESNRNKLIISLVLGIPMTIWLFANGMNHEWIHAVIYDYVPFIILLGALFVITGGIFVEGSMDPTPATNLKLIGIGTLLASVMGTTGAAMLMIRPLINANKNRKYKVHTILFFIATAANCGGLLTPLGDPPLFMMYLRGTPFFWFLNLIKEWAVINVLILTIYYIVDSYYYRKEDKESLKIAPENKKPFRIYGKMNFVWLLGVVLAVAFINPQTIEFIKMGTPSAFIREGVILLMAILSLSLTKEITRIKNQFSWEPINEVAFLFLGIFITMVPCLMYLETHAQQLGVDTPTMVYYSTGALSSFLDNTPTAVTFYSLVVGLVENEPMLMQGAVPVAGIPTIFMEAIAISSVLFGSMTYIGNGPNFMVKAIAESQGINMPEFFQYIFKFSLIVLLPLFILAQILFIH